MVFVRELAECELDVLQLQSCEPFSWVDAKVRFRDITDVTTNTLLFTESLSLLLGWDTHELLAAGNRFQRATH